MRPRQPRRTPLPPRRRPESGGRAGGRRRGRALAGALTLAALIGLPAAARAQPGGGRPPPPFLAAGAHHQEEGRRILETFRRQGIQGDYYLGFELRVLPRRGEERVLHGSMWGTRTAAGPVSRVQLQPAGPDGREVRLLVQSGATPALWRWTAGTGSAPERLDVAALFAPLAGTDLTAFDLQMPFLYWTDFVYEGLARMLGRPAHQFLFYPPADFTAQHPALTGVRVYLDTQYVAMVQAELIGSGGRPLKVVSLLDLKKVGDQWIVKAIDLRDETTRNKTRFVVQTAALNLQLPPAVFDPAGLAAPLAPPADLVRVAAP